MKSFTAVRFIVLFVGMSLVHIHCNSSSSAFGEDDYVRFAKEIESSINKKDPTLLDNALHTASLIEKAAKTAKITDPEILQKATEEASQSVKIGSQIVGLISDMGNFGFTKYYKKGEVPHLVFRSYSNEGINYYDYELGEVDGEIKILDGTWLLMGDTFSGSLARMGLLSQYQEGSEVDPEFEALIVEAAKVYEIDAQLIEGNGAQALAIFESIPEKFKEQMFLQALQVRIASYLDEATYQKAQTSFVNLYPDEARIVHFIVLLSSLASNQVDKARQSINELRKHVGNDPMLFLYEGLTYHSENQYDKALPLYEKVVELLPDLYDGYGHKLSCLMDAERYDEAAAFAKVIVEKLDVTKMDLENIFSEFPDFLESEAYQRWKE